MSRLSVPGINDTVLGGVEFRASTSRSESEYSVNNPTAHFPTIPKKSRLLLNLSIPLTMKQWQMILVIPWNIYKCYMFRKFIFTSRNMNSVILKWDHILINGSEYYHFQGVLASVFWTAVVTFVIIQQKENLSISTLIIRNLTYLLYPALINPALISVAGRLWFDRCSIISGSTWQMMGIWREKVFKMLKIKFILLSRVYFYITFTPDSSPIPFGHGRGGEAVLTWSALRKFFKYTYNWIWWVWELFFYLSW